jgi:uncharacterized protein YndB with AHSA1/START domain
VHKLRAGPGKRRAYQHGPTNALQKPAADESVSTRNTQTHNPLERVADHGSPNARFRIDAGPSDHVNHDHAAPEVGEYQQRSACGVRPSSFLSGDVIFRRQWAWGRTSGGLEVAAAARSPMEVQMPYTFTLTSIIPATPRQIYAAWLDSIEHSEMTGGEANMSDEIGAEVSAWDGYITGSNLELVPGERIVQAWRTSEFADEHADSVVTVTLESVEEGTLLTLVHSNVPDSHRSYEEGGWESQYFDPMKAYFARLEQEEAAEEPEPQEEPQELSQEAEPEEAAVVHIVIEEAPPPAPKKARKAKTKPAAPPAEVAPAPPKKEKRPAAAKGRRKAAGAKKSARRAAPKRAAPKRAAAKKAAARKATSKKGAAKKGAPKRSTARKAVGKKAGAKSKAGRRKAGRR